MQISPQINPDSAARNEDHKVKARKLGLAVKTAALLPTISWAPFFFALVIPGTAVEDQRGHLPHLAGVPANLVPATLIPAICALGYALHGCGQ